MVALKWVPSAHGRAGDWWSRPGARKKCRGLPRGSEDYLVGHRLDSIFGAGDHAMEVFPTRSSIRRRGNRKLRIRIAHILGRESAIPPAQPMSRTFLSTQYAICTSRAGARPTRNMQWVTGPWLRIGRARLAFTSWR